MGWVIVIAIRPMMQVVPAGCLTWMLIGGISYTTGVIFYAWKRLPYNHAVWHLFVLAGSIFQSRFRGMVGPEPRWGREGMGWGIMGDS